MQNLLFLVIIFITIFCFADFFTEEFLEKLEKYRQTVVGTSVSLNLFYKKKS